MAATDDKWKQKCVYRIFDLPSKQKKVITPSNNIEKSNLFTK